VLRGKASTTQPAAEPLKTGRNAPFFVGAIEDAAGGLPIFGTPLTLSRATNL
jgi:hypothetical protein